MTTSDKIAENPYQAAPSPVDPNLQYRSLNRAAVGSVVMVLLGLLSLLFWQLLILPIAGLLLGYSAYRNIKRYPDEYTGLNVARFGIAASLLLFAGTVSYHAFIFATEVPEGYDRVYFSDLRSPAGQPDRLPKKALEIQGKKIFVKGYVHPGVSGNGKVRQFVLVPDMGTCCFGGQPKATDMILVNTTPECRVQYAPRLLRMGGEFKVGDRVQKFGELKDVIYQLEADYAK